jgi:hypothetical protein
MRWRRRCARRRSGWAATRSPCRRSIRRRWRSRCARRWGEARGAAGGARRRHLQTAPGRLALAVLAAALLRIATYALAELLAYRITQPQIFGTLIPAIGATPYILCGAIYPIAALP